MSSNGAEIVNNGDRDKEFTVTIGGVGGDTATVHGIGSFHKTLPHNTYGEVEAAAFVTFKAELDKHSTPDFTSVPPGAGGDTLAFTNPRAGLAKDRLIHMPDRYTMPPAPTVLSDTTAAEMVELYWMALLRDVPLNSLDSAVATAVREINAKYQNAADLVVGIDLPGAAGGPMTAYTPQTIFRVGMPGEDVGPMLSQFFVRPIGFGTQTIDCRQRPYKAGRDYLTRFDDWLRAQNSGKDRHGQGYPKSNENGAANYEDEIRYISTMRDLARFVNKDALHQAYFNAALVLLSGGAKWTAGNPYGDTGALKMREAGFGVLGGPHILALVSEVATRALKVAWFQKWQTHLRLRPEAYGGLAHVQKIGVNGVTRGYGLPDWLFETEAAQTVFKDCGGYLLPIAFSAGSPPHPSYGAGHATVAGACVTVLKAFFETVSVADDGEWVPIPFITLQERDEPYGGGGTMTCYATGKFDGVWRREPLDKKTEDMLTIEGELNKLAQNVAMGRSMGGVHWRSDNTRSLILGEALAAEILLGIAEDIQEKTFKDKDKKDVDVTFRFRTFARDTSGKPGHVTISHKGIEVNGQAKVPPFSSLM